jgi:hypothetical protein
MALRAKRTYFACRSFEFDIPSKVDSFDLARRTRNVHVSQVDFEIGFGLLSQPSFLRAAWPKRLIVSSTRPAGAKHTIVRPVSQISGVYASSRHCLLFKLIGALVAQAAFSHTSTTLVGVQYRSLTLLLPFTIVRLRVQHGVAIFSFHKKAT